MTRWERKKSGVYQYLERTLSKWRRDSADINIIAEVVKCADGKWLLDYLHDQEGKRFWSVKRCASKRNAQAIAEENC